MSSPSDLHCGAPSCLAHTVFLLSGDAVNASGDAVCASAAHVASDRTYSRPITCEQREDGGVRTAVWSNVTDVCERE